MLQKNKNLIITADDFGISKKSSMRILELAAQGKFERIEIMMSQNLTKLQADEIIKSGVKIDIHFHFIADKLDGWQNREKEYVENNFKRVFKFILNYFSGKTAIESAHREWKQQLDDFKKLFGRYPDGVSSHEHIHFFPAYFKILLELAKIHDIGYIRLGKKKIGGRINLIILILRTLKKINQAAFKKSNLDSSDIFLSFDWLKKSKKLLCDIPSGEKVELVFHCERDDEYKFLKENI